jgi:hypothetical protein
MLPVPIHQPGLTFCGLISAYPILDEFCSKVPEIQTTQHTTAKFCSFDRFIAVSEIREAKSPSWL